MVKLLKADKQDALLLVCHTTYNFLVPTEKGDLNRHKDNIFSATKTF